MKHITVVYSIADQDNFKAEMDKLSTQLSNAIEDLKTNSWAVTAISVDHEIKRLELIEEAAQDEDFDLINAILGHPDIGNISTLEEL